MDDIKRKVFVEDLSNEEKAKYLKENYNEILAYGLVNLGNTCYINSALQCMRNIPELKSAVVNSNAATDMGMQMEGGGFISSMAGVFQSLENSGDTVEPRMFIANFMNQFPQFAQKGKHGGFQQQDADEAFQAVLNVVDPYVSQGNSLIDDLFKFNVEFTIKNTENEDEPTKTAIEPMRKLPCVIDNQANPINILTEGLTAGLTEEIEKHSDLEDRNCIFSKIGKLIDLPKYLIVHQMRFIWKGEDKGTRTEARKAKILRAVAFPMELDLHAYLSDELKARIEPNREVQKERDDKQIEVEKAEFEAFKAERINDENMDTLKITKAFKKQKRASKIAAFDATVYREFGTGLETGEYNLVGVITHKGRSSDGGHYVGWTHHSGEDWFKFDDDLVNKVSAQNIQELRGGGDWHIAYYLIYRKKEISKE